MGGSMKRILLFLSLFSMGISLHAQMIEEIQFRNQPVKDILLVLAEISHSSIIPDETVDGRATYLFSNMPFEEALQQFLKSQNLYSRKENDVYYVSTIYSAYDEEKDLLTLKTENEDINRIIKHISRLVGKTILYDALPREEISLQFNEGRVESLLSIIIKKFSDYSLEKDEDYFYIRKEALNDASGRRRGGYFTVHEDLYSIDLEQIRFKDALHDLLSKGKFEYSYLGKNNTIIENFSFKDKTLDQMLELLMEQGNSSYEEVNGIYYVFDRNRQDTLNKFYTTSRVPLINLSAASAAGLIPNSLTGNVSVKADSSGNALLVSGILNEARKVISYISEIDKMDTEFSWKRFDLDFIDSASISSLLPESYGHYKKIIMSDRNSFLILLRDEKAVELKSYLQLIDTPIVTRPIKLNYISSDELLEKLPPSIEDDEIQQSIDNNILYFVGNEEKWKLLKKELAYIDKPKPQIRYEVLVMQVQETDQLDLGFSYSVSDAADGAETLYSGSFDKVLNLNFDVVEQFGYQYAAKLDLALSNSDARILADTTLYGLSGEEISFQNTSTSRFEELEYDDENNLVIQSSLTEISSGLLIDIDGWVSGDRMITMEISTTISREGSSDSSSDLPTTTEKVINTHVRTPSGEPIIISGLKQRDTVQTISKVPFLGEIPLLGLLFQNRYETIETTDFYVTIVPYLETTSPLEEEDRLEGIYNRLVRKDVR